MTRSSRSRPRLGHTKSRTGCIRCRGRRVKCDQTRPVCQNCQRHNVECFYDRVAETVPSPGAPQHGQVALTTTRSEVSPSSTSISPMSIPVLLCSETKTHPLHASSPSSLPSLSFGPSQRMQLLLFHNFAVNTSSTLAGTHLPDLLRCWSVQVPPLALDDEPLFNALLALLALHLITTTTTTTTAPDPELLSCRTTWHGIALQQHRESLQCGPETMSPKTANAAFFTSILLMVYALCTLKDRPLTPYEPPLYWLRMGQGVRSVMAAALEQVAQDPGAAIWTIISASSDLYHQEPGSPREGSMPTFHYLLPLTTPSQDAATLDATENLTQKTIDVYNKTIRHLGRTQAAIESGEHAMGVARRITSFPSLIPPEAMLIMVRLFALSLPCKHLWWFGTALGREIRAIRDNLAPEWQGLMDWPLQALQRSEE
ncbi:uncharacterized protein BCR38DRAFT_460891 [Pseudomassariella vexata]|uniref:Zn(2)-C6 fungal-type domain-containing protein n=1 Tax=Pseudomassariella vexata TaxID=1141098 RepID=A0A1Y2DFY6_9PEZI|nr:uncharacterized protein BCR38DRAFT_460891 [Pseudomassariella vexata]ORY58026.1 hypothetical protein BCR38DRAFT_460891 [Pseudomassariella vexata]